jgi:MSHA biogenesis protein MshN
VSVINKMLQDLDRRNAVGADGEQPAAQSVKAVASMRRGHEWFWRVLAVMVLISVSWVGWVAYQLQPRPLVTPLALMAYENRGSGRIAVEPAQPVAAPVPVAVVQARPEPVQAPRPEPAAAEVEPAMPAEAFKLARSIETPIAEPKPGPAKAQAKKPAARPVSTLEPALPASKAVVDKRERSEPVYEAAEARFRRAAALLSDPSHVAARQAYVALLLEQQRVASASRLLREAVDANPAQPTFSLGLARVYAEQREYPAALAVIEKAGAAAQGAEFQVLRGAVLQRLGRHAEAVTAYQDALQKSAQPGGTWTGLAISLEALGRHGEAAQAYQRALAAGPMPAQLRDYAEGRIKALQ